MLPNIPKVEAHASNESAICDYCRIAHAAPSLPTMEGFNAHFDLGIEQGDSG